LLIDILALQGLAINRSDPRTFSQSKKTIPKSGAMGDPTKASREKGEKILSTVISNLVIVILSKNG
jgi:creatinine amidohydrolase/Fe(II)-dependent formamide hydrolase-like protein